MLDFTAAAILATLFPAKGSLSTAEIRSFSYGAARHEYLIQPVRGKGPYPVVFVLHGGDANDRIVWAETSLPTLGLQDRFIVVAPRAQANAHWNDGRGAVGSGAPSTADDVGYLKALVAYVVRHDNADPARVFMTGVSNGGFMTIRFACEASEVLRAGANVISTIPVKLAHTCRMRKALPWLSINGDRDRIAPLNGMTAGTLRNGLPQPALESAERTFNFFADNARCSEAAKITILPDVNTSDGSRAEKRVRARCVGGTTSTFYVLHSAGHGWPGLPKSWEETQRRGGINMDIDAGTVIWAHFKQTLP